MKRGRRNSSADSRNADPFTPGPAHSPEPAAEESPFAIFEKVHRLLRGRYHWAIALAILGAGLGALGGYAATQPLYQSIGSIHIVPVLPKVIHENELTQMPPLFASYVRTRANLLQDPRVLDAAMQSEAWRQLGRGISPEERERFRTSLRVTVDAQEPEWIWIRFADPDPDAARVAVEEIINAYIERHGAMDNIVTPEVLDRLRHIRTTHENRIRELQRMVNAIGSQFGTNDLGQIHEDAIAQLRRLDQQVSQLEWEIAEADQRLAAAGVDEPVESEPLPIMPIREIAVHDPMMRAMLSQRLTLRSDLQAREARLGPEHRDLRRSQDQLAALNNSIEQYAREWLQEHAGVIPGASSLGSVISAEGLEQLRAQLQALRPMRDAAHQRARELNDKRLEVEELRAQMQREREQLAIVQYRLDSLHTEQRQTDTAGTSPRINIVSRGEVPHAPSVDHRRKLAALGLMFGGGLPIGLILLIGLMDRRFRFVDDAGSEGKVPLLGVLPYLPDASRDPEQAGIAAHCVHQVRTLLQISAVGQQRKIFAVTSPTAGDGKTSLSLSLGLSFAASGARTCLIDFDMVGAGLTAAMQIKTDLGLLDAIERGELNGHIRPTSFTRLSLLPVGEHDAQEVSRLSPSTVRRLLDLAREEFDIVIIDTGPVLGSIEASMVCAEADGVIMTIGRGQQRPLAERSINHLGSIGARIMGVVFNRADTGDFRRAVASTSIRSIPIHANGHHGGTRHLPALGPMASTLVLHGDDEEDQ
jgi:polysaccharide biosynthesis transport protein